MLRTDLLGVWAGWLTPVFEPKRYRTWFFVALLPEGQRTRDVSSESSEVTWLPAVDALAMAERGEMLMLPPTYLTSLEVAQYAGPAEVVEAAHGRIVEMHTPGLEALGEGWTLSVPEHLRPLLAAHKASMTWVGGTFGERARCLLAPNPGIMTLDGTNTWVLARARCLPVDRHRPGPASRTATSTSSTSRPATSALVLLTHHHADHSEVAVEFATRKGCPVRALDPAYCFDADPLADGEVIDVEGLELRVRHHPRPHRGLDLASCSRPSARC